MRKQSHRVVFESFFDLTTERLEHIFTSFDLDRDGKISYKALKKGLEDWINVPALQEDMFQMLVSKIDGDKHLGKADVSLSEFTTAVRMLFMTYLFDENIVQGNLRGMPIDVVDYSPIDVARTLFSSEKEVRGFFSGKRNPVYKCRWIDLGHSTDSGHQLMSLDENIVHAQTLTLKRLAVKYVLHPLALEDALEGVEDQRAKVDFYKTHFFLLVPIFRIVDKSIGKRRRFADEKQQDGSKQQGCGFSVEIEYLSMFLSYPNFETLITFHKTEDVSLSRGCSSVPGLPAADNWARVVMSQLEKSYSKLRLYDVQYLAYSILDALVSRIPPIVRLFRAAIESERRHLMVSGDMNIFTIDELRGNIEKLQRGMRPLMRAFTHIIEDERICDGVTIYLRDVRDDLLSADDDLRELVAKCDVLNADFEKIHQQQMDKTIYTLTVITSIFLPAQFLTGVFGMNFKEMPELDWEYSYLVFWVFCVLVTILLLLYFRCGSIESKMARRISVVRRFASREGRL